ncbi:hypothetical protein DL89DRAFT_268767 [Linderina pennispora]|uniref:Uncharacterized protein n=1 Tax=Linderina pennispora TaxID=61395 RepID=A0A1Y1W3X6_9FUNG|nr:uncharacterized protein DL89DRAFT_268767 [Linderina pennispora]ORX68263.1 hypothetical protein DL89DRAFT_268767 [Linderina pennispora]
MPLSSTSLSCGGDLCRIQNWLSLAISSGGRAPVFVSTGALHAGHVPCTETYDDISNSCSNEKSELAR